MPGETMRDVDYPVTEYGLTTIRIPADHPHKAAILALYGEWREMQRKADAPMFGAISCQWCGCRLPDTDGYAHGYGSCVRYPSGHPFEDAQVGKP